MFPQKRLMIFALLLLYCFTLSYAQSEETEEETALSPQNIGEYVPVNVFASPIRAMSADGQFIVIGEPLPAFGYTGKLVNPAGEVLLDLQATNYVIFVGSEYMLHVSLINSLSPRLYSLPDLEEVGRFPLSTLPTPRQYGDGFFYIINEKQVFYQPSDFSQETFSLVNNLYRPYYGVVAEYPESSILAITSELSIILYDLDTRERLEELQFPSGRTPQFSEDGKRLSVITNDGQAWLAYDMEEAAPIVELFSSRAASGAISQSGRYGAATRQVTDSNIAELSIYDLDSGNVLLQTDTGRHASLFFIGERLVYVDDYNGDAGVIAVFDPDDGTGRKTSVTVQRFTQLYTAQDMIALSDYDVRQTRLFDPVSRQVVATYNGLATFFENTFALDNVLFGLPTEDQPALTTLTGSTSSDNINVRSFPSANGTRLTGATGSVTALARTEDNTWVYLSSHGGWVSTDLVRLNGDLSTLMAVTP